jgi:hypothetical protein
MQRFLRTTGLALLVCAAPVMAQDESKPTKLDVRPTKLELEVGEKAQLKTMVLDAGGDAMDVEVIFFSRGRKLVTVDKEGNVEALAPGQATLIARTQRRGGERLSVEIPVTVNPPAVARVELGELGGALYTGTVRTLPAVVYDVNGAERAEVEVSWSSSAPRVASFDSFGYLNLHTAGSFTAVASAEGKSSSTTMNVLANPLATIDIALDRDSIRTGDVVHITATGRDGSGAAIEDVPVLFSFTAAPDDQLGQRASGQITQDGRFVADTPGIYTIVATSGAASNRVSLRADARNVEMQLEEIGRGEVYDTHTSDLWVWEGVDGGDYAVTGTWGADGDAHFWDVTDPAAIKRISTVSVDARTVNDVKVSEDGRYCVISREGASNRKNGIVIFDVSNPRDPKRLSTFDENLTGGVHNVFIDGHHIFALSAGQRYDVIDIEDPLQPSAVGTFELGTPNHSIHDVWVEDGIAYSSNWGDGLQLVDVGNGVAGGSPTNPVWMAEYAYPSGRNHAAFPYRDKETGRFYVVAGDEAFPYGLQVTGGPTYPRGWLHFVDFTDLENPEEVARYQVPEAGSHNLWIEGDMLYAAFYNGGVRVVDISGELLGDLYRQGREIAFFLPSSTEGFVVNAPMVWGPQPYKGHIFFSDWNTGLWAMKLSPKKGRR